MLHNVIALGLIVCKPSIYENCYTFIFIHMHKNMAAEFKTNHMTPKLNNVSPWTPENNNANSTTNAVNIHNTRTRL